jgi:spore maturation protein CgeB
MKWLFAAPLSGVRTSIFISNYYSSLARAAERAGVIVEMHDTEEVIASPRVPPFVRSLYRPLSHIVDRHRLLTIMEGGMKRKLVEHVRRFLPDVVFLYVINAQSMDSAVREIKKIGCKVVMWRGLSPDNLSEGIRRVLSEIDCLFIYDKTYVSLYHRLGCRKVELVPLGIDTRYIDSISPGSGMPKISFIGMIDDKRFRLLSRLADLSLGVWSWNYSRSAYPILASLFRGEASGDKAISILKSSLVSLNAHRDFEQSGGNYRLFEIAASGALQLVDDMPDISRYFTPGEEIITYRNENDLRDKVLYYLRNENERCQIAANAYQRVKRSHDIDDRFKLISDVVKSI